MGVNNTFDLLGLIPHTGDKVLQHVSLEPCVLSRHQNIVENTLPTSLLFDDQGAL